MPMAGTWASVLVWEVYLRFSAKSRPADWRVPRADFRPAAVLAAIGDDRRRYDEDRCFCDTTRAANGVRGRRQC